MKIYLDHYLILSAMIFVVGIVGILINRSNLILILMSLELILLSININLISFSYVLNDITGQIFSIFVFTVAAAEAAIGLAIVVICFKNYGDLNIQDINKLRG